MGKLLWSNISAEGDAGTHPYRGPENINILTGLAIHWLAIPCQGSLEFFWAVLPYCYTGGY
jgi:hypothetical protein